MQTTIHELDGYATRSQEIRVYGEPKLHAAARWQQLTNWEDERPQGSTKRQNLFHSKELSEITGRWHLGYASVTLRMNWRDLGHEPVMMSTSSFVIEA